MTRLLHLSPTFYSAASVVGGGERYIIYAARAIALAAEELGRPVTNTLAAFGEKPGTYQLSGDVTCQVLEARPWDVTSIQASEIQDLIRDFDVVFVHQCLYPFGLFLGAQAQIAGKYVVGLDHGSGEHPIAYHTPEVGLIYDRFQAQSAFVAATFTDLQGVIEITPGPVDTEFYTPSPGPRDPAQVVAVGRILPHKGFDRIINQLPNGLSLSVIGSGYDQDYFSHLERIAAGKSVRFVTGADDDEVRDILRGAGLFVHASTHTDYRGRHYAKPELLGLAPLEALACGIPTLVSSAGSLPELAAVDGCETFATDEVLATLLRDHAEGRIDWPGKQLIAKDVEAKYGLRQYGRKVLHMLGMSENP